MEASFKAANNRDKNFTKAKVQRWRAQLEESVARYLSQLDLADRQEPSEALAAKATRLKEKLTKLKEEMSKLAVYEKQMRGHGPNREFAKRAATTQAASFASVRSLN
jgi:transposase